MKKTRIVGYVGMMLLLLAAAIFAGSGWTTRTASAMADKTAAQISQLYLRELSSSTSKHMRSALQYHFAHLDSVARLLTDDIADDEQALLHYLNDMKETYQLSFLAFVDEDGFYHDGTGVYPAASKVSFLSKLLHGETHLISYNEKIQNDEVILLGTSLPPVPSRDVHFVGVLAGLDTETMMKTMVLANEQSHTYSSVVTRDGTYVILSEPTGHFRGSNLLSTLKRAATFANETDLRDLTEGLRTGGTGTFYLTTQTGEGYYLYHSPLPNTDWALVTLMPYAVIESMILELGASINHNSLSIFCIFLTLLFVLFALYIWFSRKKQHQLETTRAMAEQAFSIAEDANRAKSVFLSNMSHDIRTPMNAIIGFVTLIQRDAEDPDKVREYAQKITHSSQHLLGLINDVLDMTKIESGKATLNLDETSLAEVIDDINTIIRPQMKEKGHQFDIEIRNVRHEMVQVDKLRLHQILLNLLTNAVKYTPNGGHVVLEVAEIEQASPQLAKYSFRVTDNGYGIDPQYLNSIFDIFSREQNSVISKTQGTGLGLAITKNLIDLMGGTITVESEKGKGSVFTVELDLRLADVTEHEDFWKRHRISHILVVDDEESVGRNVEWTMAQVGVRVDTALDGKTAIERVTAAQNSSFPYQTILLDWKMPGQSGIEVAQQIRHIVPTDVPIMILTSYDYSEIEDKAMDGVVDGFLPKPFFEGSFRYKLQEILEGTRPTTPAATGPNSLQGKHVLVAEDNELNAEILTELLEMEGATCDVFENGKLAQEAFAQSQPGTYQLILMDVQMPVMNGYDATRLIRGCAHPQAKTIPIVAMTANAFAEDIQRSLDAGMDAHLAKPVDMDRLRKLVHELL
ncbi:MAG: response regulator [Eubacteriales bacterium]|nr:response regulator [Eubacteriales bacterium]